MMALGTYMQEDAEVKFRRYGTRVAIMETLIRENDTHSHKIQ